MSEGDSLETSAPTRRHHEVRRRADQLWLERCGDDPSVDPEQFVEVTGRWNNGERVHSSHLVRIAGVRSFGCVHARPWLGWYLRSAQRDWVTCCWWDDCAAGGSDES